MQIDIKAKELKPIRNAYSHLARRFGEDKTATRYQEAVYDIQATEHFHYRPTWQPDKELYDEARTAIKMDDWYKFIDPRQYYYGSYCMVRAKQQETAEQNFKFVEKRKLLSTLSSDVIDQIKKVILPLRHYEWGANMNNSQICAMGYGASITSAAMLHAADRLGNAQYITRIGLVLAENDSAIIDEAKTLWMEDADWQGIRKLVEDSLVVEDWFELFIAQNYVMDGLIHPIFFEAFDDKLNDASAVTYSMMTEFIMAFYSESNRWVDKQITVACAESDANKQIVSGWFKKWLSETESALKPLVNYAFSNGDEVLAQAVEKLKVRASKHGIEL